MKYLLALLLIATAQAETPYVQYLSPKCLAPKEHLEVCKALNKSHYEVVDSAGSYPTWCMCDKIYVESDLPPPLVDKEGHYYMAKDDMDKILNAIKGKK